MFNRKITDCNVKQNTNKILLKDHENIFTKTSDSAVTETPHQVFNHLVDHNFNLLNKHSLPLFDT